MALSASVSSTKTGQPVRERLERLRLPIVVAPMFLVSTPELVIESCRAGVVGSFPSPNVRTAAELAGWCQRIVDAIGSEGAAYSTVTGDAASVATNFTTASATDQRSSRGVAPWALNLVTHRTNGRLPEDLAVVAEYQPPIVITALGSPKPALETVHRYGGLVFADVASVAMARKAAEAGVDGLVLVCAGAGGHTGELCHPVFIESVREFFDGLVIVGGGLASGRSVAAMKVLGADLGYLGTHFIAAAETMANDEYRQMLIESDASDLLITRAFTGARASMLKPSIRAKGLDPVALEFEVAKLNFTGRSGEKTKAWSGIYGAGQGVGRIHSIRTTREIIDELATGYDRATLPRESQIGASAR